MRVPYSERERGPRPRTNDAVDERSWGGLVVLIQNLVGDGSFGAGYPSYCPDGRGVDGCDEARLGTALRAEVAIDWPISANEVPQDQLAIFDMLEFLFANVGKPIEQDWHSYFSHHHLSFDVPTGQAEFADSINRVFARNGLAFKMETTGQIRKLLPEYAAELVSSAIFHTGDAEADRLLEYGRSSATSPSLERRRDGLEKLWDAFERLKTLEDGKDKRVSAETMLNHVVSGPVFRAMLGTEARELTNIGNASRIRHSEVNQELLVTPDQVDYLYVRMFGFLRLLLRASGRGG